MNEQLKLKFTDDLQKTLTRNCYNKCKSVKNEDCYDTCFEKFVRTASTINSEIRELAYKKHSLFGYKGYPEHSITSAYYYDQDLTFNLNRAPFVWNRYYAG